MNSTEQISPARFVSVLNDFLDETFETVGGIYLDKGTSLFETLATVSAEEASRPVSARCASIAAQVEHVRFYLEVLSRYVRKEEVGKVDWSESWRLTGATVEEWEALVSRLREQYDSTRRLINGIEDWSAEDLFGDAMAIVVHTAYHLGEIRQALCTVRY